MPNSCERKIKLFCFCFIINLIKNRKKRMFKQHLLNDNMKKGENKSMTGKLRIDKK
jgi:hypothetical protein